MNDFESITYIIAKFMKGSLEIDLAPGSSGTGLMKDQIDSGYYEHSRLDSLKSRNAEKVLILYVALHP